MSLCWVVSVVNYGKRMVLVSLTCPSRGKSDKLSNVFVQYLKVFCEERKNLGKLRIKTQSNKTETIWRMGE